MDLRPLYDDFLAYQEARGCSPLTLVAYRQDFNRLREFLQSPKLEALTGPLIRRYMVWFREQGFKQWSIRRRISSLRSFLNYCIDEELLERHTMNRVPTPKVPETVPDDLTLEEVQKERMVPLEPSTEERLRALQNGGITHGGTPVRVSCSRRERRPSRSSFLLSPCCRNG